MNASMLNAFTGCCVQSQISYRDSSHVMTDLYTLTKLVLNWSNTLVQLNQFNFENAVANDKWKGVWMRKTQLERQLNSLIRVLLTYSKIRLVFCEKRQLFSVLLHETTKFFQTRYSNVKLVQFLTKYLQGLFYTFTS